VEHLRRCRGLQHGSPSAVGVKCGYVPGASRSISMNDLRAEMMSVCVLRWPHRWRIHHHEVAPTQNELGFPSIPW